MVKGGFKGGMNKKASTKVGAKVAMVKKEAKKMFGKKK